jgi:DNA primase
MQNDDAKEQVRRLVDIVDLVGSYLPLQRSGRGFKALCPWHDDSRPSLLVNPERQTFKCWVCNIGGDIFSFVMKREGIAFPEALVMLAERAGVTLSAAARSKPTQAGDPDDKPTLYRAMSWIEEQYHAHLLHAAEAAPARKYLADRGISPQSIARFRLGFAPTSWDWLAEQARVATWNLEVIEATGSVTRRPNGPGYYDRFRDRVLFSIRDGQGRPVGIGGRVLPGAPTDTAKYINTAETPLFSKNKLLYGLDLAKDSMSRARTALVMEGYTDCIMAHQHGITNCVAVLGTALGEQHVRLLRGFADRVVLVLDGDAAGMRRTNEILPLFLAANVDVRVLTLPDGLDPCDYLQRHGPAGFKSLVDSAADALEHCFQTAVRGIDPARETHAAHRALEDVLAAISKSPRAPWISASAAQLKEDQIVFRLSQKFGVPIDRLRNRLADLRRPRPSTPASLQSAQSAQEPQSPASSLAAVVERSWIEILLEAPQLVETARTLVGSGEFGDGQLRTIYEFMLDAAEVGEPADFHRLLAAFEDPQVQNLLVSLDEEGRAKGRTDLPLELAELAATFRRARQDRRIREQAALLASSGQGGEEQLDFFRRVLAEKRQREGIQPTSGQRTSVSTDG